MNDKLLDHIDYTIEIGLIVLVLIIVILCVLVWRGGRSAETSATIREIRKVGDQVENMRSQNTNEHAPMQDYIEWIYARVRRICERLGFLEDKNIPEPPLPPSVKPKNDDIH